MNVEHADRADHAEKRIVLAALDASAAAGRRVLAAAVAVAEMVDGTVEAVHVHGEIPDSLVALARSAEVPLRRLAGRPEGALLAAMEASEVALGVVIAGGATTGRHPLGRMARHLVERTAKPVVVVPYNATVPARIRCLLVPLEGTEATTRPVLGALLPLLAVDVDVIVLHVFTDETLPRMLDRPQRDLALLGREFLAVHCPPAARIELGTGPVAASVAEASSAHAADLIVLSWTQNTSPGRAQVVREVLGASTLPVLLLPAGPAASGEEPS